MPIINHETQLPSWKVYAASALEAQSEGDLERAEREYEICISLARDLRGPIHEDVGEAIINRADFLMAVKRYQEAEACYRDALRVYECMFGKENLVSAMIYRVLAELCLAQGKRREAQILQARSVLIVAERKLS